MKSRMSFCNAAVLKRTLFRGIPLWGAYLLCWLIALPVVLWTNGQYQEVVYLKDYVLETAVAGSTWISFAYGIAVACMVSSYQYKSRSANFFASTPMRRETMFLTQYLAGLCFSIVPNLIVGVLTIPAGLYWGTNLVPQVLVWLGAQFLGYLFYYSFAMLISVLVGNLIALPLVYLVLNFMAIIVESIVRQLLEFFVHGSWFSSDFTFDWASPVYYVMTCQDRIRVKSEYVDGVFAWSEFVGWKMLAIYAAVGLVLAAAAFMIHRKRRVESAGDVIAIRHLKPVFLYVFTGACSLCIGYVLASIIFGGLSNNEFTTVMICMLVGAFIGYFIGQMMLQRTVRVFHKKNFLHYGITALVVVALLLCVRFDPFGYSRYVPQEDQVEAVMIGPYDDCFMENTEMIHDTVELHRILVKSEEPDDDEIGRTVYLSYRMKDGRLVRRRYHVPAGEKASLITDSPIRRYERLYNYPDYIVRRELGVTDYSVQDIMSCAVYSGSDTTYLTPVEAYELLKTCIEPDLRETLMGWNYLSDYEPKKREYVGADIEIQFTDGENGHRTVSRYCYFNVTTDAAHTLAFLQEKGIDVKQS